MQRDPINSSQTLGGYQDGLSKYQYLLSSPIKHMDSSGEFVYMYDDWTVDLDLYAGVFGAYLGRKPFRMVDIHTRPARENLHLGKNIDPRDYFARALFRQQHTAGLQIDFIIRGTAASDIGADLGIAVDRVCIDGDITIRFKETALWITTFDFATNTENLEKVKPAGEFEKHLRVNTCMIRNNPIPNLIEFDYGHLEGFVPGARGWELSPVEFSRNPFHSPFGEEFVPPGQPGAGRIKNSPPGLSSIHHLARWDIRIIGLKYDLNMYCQSP